MKNDMEKNMFHIDNEPKTAASARKLVLEAFEDLELYEEDHKYVLHGRVLPSVSGIAERFVRYPFDPERTAARQADRYGETPEYWIHKWECNSFRATTLGRKTHAFGESLGYLRTGHPELITDDICAQYLPTHHYLAPISPKEEAVVRFFDELPDSYHLVLNEAMVYSGKNPDASRNLHEQIAGTFDMLYWYDGEGDPTKAGFVILDYKTNASLYKDYARQRQITLLPPFDNIIDEDYGHYMIQLNLYALMLEDIGLPVIAKRIVWLKDDATYEIIDVPNIVDTLRKAL